MTRIPATRREHRLEDLSDLECAAADALPHLPSPGPAARIILALFGDETVPAFDLSARTPFLH